MSFGWDEHTLATMVGGPFDGEQWIPLTSEIEVQEADGTIIGKYVARLAGAEMLARLDDFSVPFDFMPPDDLPVPA